MKIQMTKKHHHKPPVIGQRGKILVSGWWAKVRPRLVDNMVAKQHVASPVCQKCYSSPAMIHCCDCRPQPFLCAHCDISIHKAQVFHNRDSIREGFFQPLPPTSCFVENVLTQCGKLQFLRVRFSHLLISVGKLNTKI